MAEGYTGGGPGGDTTAGFNAGRLANLRNGNKPTLQKTKSVVYKSGAISDNIFSISKDVSETGAEGMPRAVRVSNTGGTPLIVMTGYETFTNTTTSADNVQYLHTMLLPGESFNPSVRAAISNHTDKFLLDGTALDNQAPHSNMFEDISTVTSGFDNTTDPVTFVAGDGDLFRVGDMTRCNAEVSEVTAIDGNNVTVKRGMLGTNAASHGDGETLRLQFSNDYHDIDKFSVSQTDHNGKFKCSNTFGKGRNAGAVDSLSGITPGSLSLKFYTQGAYQSLGLSGVSGSTITGLNSGRLYGFNITVDGGTEYVDLSFTTDTSNLRFGGANGLIEKIQSALDAQFYVDDGNLFEKKVIVGLSDGDLRFSSSSNLSTSAISLANATGGGGVYNFFNVGRIPPVGNINSAVASSLPDDTIYDPITYSQGPNTSAFAYDDGRGNISGAAQGKVNYETGSIDIRSAPKNSEFVYSVIHSGAFSGKLDSEDIHKNALVDIYANTTSQKWNGQVSVEAWK